LLLRTSRDRLRTATLTNGALDMRLAATTALNDLARSQKLIVLMRKKPKLGRLGNHPSHDAPVGLRALSMHLWIGRSDIGLLLATQATKAEQGGLNSRIQRRMRLGPKY
jgi:hypothetical protein